MSPSIKFTYPLILIKHHLGHIRAERVGRQGHTSSVDRRRERPRQRHDVAGWHETAERAILQDLAWTAWAIASNEIASRHRIDLDATIIAMAQTAKDMNSKYKETSQAGLALSVTLC